MSRNLPEIIKTKLLALSNTYGATNTSSSHHTLNFKTASIVLALFPRGDNTTFFTNDMKSVLAEIETKEISKNALTYDELLLCARQVNEYLLHDESLRGIIDAGYTGELFDKEIVAIRKNTWKASYHPGLMTIGGCVGFATALIVANLFKGESDFRIPNFLLGAGGILVGITSGYLAGELKAAFFDEQLKKNARCIGKMFGDWNYREMNNSLKSLWKQGNPFQPV